MNNQLSKADQKKLVKLEDTFEQLVSGEECYFSITRLLSIKSLCKEKSIRQQYCLYLYKLLAGRLLEAKEQKPVTGVVKKIYGSIQDVYEFSVDELATPKAEKQVRTLFYELQSYQNETKRIKSNVVRMLKSSDLLTLEYLMGCLLSNDESAQKYAYYATRNHVEKYNSSIGTGLITDSIPALGEVLVFWRGLSGEHQHLYVL